MNDFFKKNLNKVLLVTFLIIGFYLRIGGVLTNSFAFTYDVGRDLLEVQKIVKEFDIPLIGQTTGLGGLYYGPWWYYILSLPFIFSNGNPQGIAFFMVLIGVATIVSGYLLGKIISGKTLGFLIAGFLASSSAMVGLSVQIWNPNIAPFLLVLLFILVFSRTKSYKKKIFINIIIGFIFGLILDSEIVFGVFIIVGIGISLLIIEKKQFFSLQKFYIILGLLISLLPRIVFEFKHNFIMTKSLLGSKTEEQEIINFFNFFNVLPDRINILLSQIGDTFGLEHRISILFSLFSIGIWFRFRKEQTRLEKKLTVILGVLLGTFLIGSSIFARAVWGHYLVGLPVIYILLVSLIILLLIKKKNHFGFALFLTLFVTSMRPMDVINGIKNPYWEGNAAVYRNQIAVIDYIYKDAKKKKFNYVAYTPAVHDYPYQYLFSWYGKNTYGYIPSKETENLFYVILEPDPGFEWRKEEWLKVREGDGKVMEENLIKGGISVQKRVR